MGRKKRNNSGFAAPDEGTGIQQPKRAKNGSDIDGSSEAGEVFLVKKYRAERHYASMDAFVRYTKAHRMLDASYVRWNTGVTEEKPFVFSTRVGGTDLGWGRGKTREAAMDCAVRAAFALVNAHGYKNFPLDDDCLLQPPTDVFPPLLQSAPPPPPPPPLPPLPPGMTLTLPLPPLPPLPPSGMVGHLLPPPPPPPPHPQLGLLLPPPPPPIPATDMIPQPLLPQAVPVASSLLSNYHSHYPPLPGSTAVATTTLDGSAMTAVVTPPVVSLTFNNSNGNSSKPATKTVLKGGLTLVYDPLSEGPGEISMEERRSILPRYQKMLIRARASASVATVKAA